MTLTFVHTADWQIGKAFAQFPADVAAQLRAARMDAIDRVAEVALGASADHVLVAGDVFDSELLDRQVLHHALRRMQNYPALQWKLLPGNHDPNRAGGVWSRLMQLGLPPNVALLLASRPEPVGERAVLLPAPLETKQTSSDPTAWMDGAATAEGILRIGIAHGSVRGFGSLGEAAVPIEPARRRSAGLDYLALGDWHGTKEIAEGVWYSGTPEPDSFMDNDPGHVLLVSIDGPGATPRVRRVATARHRWLERRVALSAIADFAPVEMEVAALGPAASRSILRLSIEGAIGAVEAARLDERVAAVEASLLSARVDTTSLRILASRSDRETLGDDALRAIADRLVAQSEDAEGEAARTAARAVQKLLAYAAELRRRDGSA